MNTKYKERFQPMLAQVEFTKEELSYLDVIPYHYEMYNYNDIREEYIYNTVNNRRCSRMLRINESHLLESKLIFIFVIIFTSH